MDIIEPKGNLNYIENKTVRDQETFNFLKCNSLLSNDYMTIYAHQQVLYIPAHIHIYISKDIYIYKDIYTYQSDIYIYIKIYKSKL